MSSDQYAQLYDDAAKEYGLDPALLMAQGEFESAGKSDAVGKPTKWGQAHGVAQLLPDTARRLGVTDPNDPKQAIYGQAKLMAENLKRYGDPETALMAYHGGTDQSNWGPVTKAYPANVYKHYKAKTTMGDTSATANIPVDDEEDPVAYARRKLAEKSGNPIVAQEMDEEDPVAYARAKLAEKQTAKVAADQVSTPIDMLETAPSAVAKGVGMVPQALGYGVNALANTMGEATYGVRRAMGYPKDDALYNKLTNLNPILTGNTLADPLAQAAQQIVTQQPAEANPVSGNVIHDPQTAPARYENALIQTMIAGKAGNGTTLPNVKALPLTTGTIAAQTASEAIPGSPSAQLLAGLAGGTAPSAVRSIKLRATPEELAHNVINTQLGNPTAPTAPFSYPHENPLVPGVRNTLTEVTGDPNLALVQRQLQSKNPSLFRDQENNNESARQQHFEGASGTPQDIETMEQVRSNTSGPLYEVARKHPLDPKVISPVMSKIDAAIEEVGEGSDAGKTLLGLKDKINKALPSVDEETGKAKNPTQSPLIQIFREERDNLTKPATAQGAYAGTVKSVIQPIVHELGAAIESQSPEFAQAQNIYRTQSPAIDAAKWLQNLKLTDAGGRYTLAKVKNALDNAKKAQGTPGNNKAKSVSPQQLNILQNLHDDLMRREKPMIESMDRGSPTKQNLLAEAQLDSRLTQADNLLTGGKGVEIGGSMLGATLLAPFGAPATGAYLGNVGARLTKLGSEKRAVNANAKLEKFMLDPQAYKNYLLNSGKDNYSTRFLNKMFVKP